jgi:redox-sensitive bicupin YhaK (pirin superfamily)
MREFDTLGGANHGWLKAKHHFSFASYYDPKQHELGRAAGLERRRNRRGTGFPPHPHSDMEIITYVREGAITHQDNLGNKGRTEAGDVQVMSAGTGIRHSEYNLEPETTRIFQIWIEPNLRRGGALVGRQAVPQGRPLGQVRDPGQRASTMTATPCRSAPTPASSAPR